MHSHYIPRYNWSVLKNCAQIFDRWLLILEAKAEIYVRSEERRNDLIKRDAIKLKPLFNLSR
jgi:hypothetical protein